MPALASRDSIIEHARLLTRRRVFYCMSMPLADRIWTVEAVRALADDGNRYEVIDGELFVTPAPSWTHQNAVLKMYRMHSLGPGACNLISSSCRSSEPHGHRITSTKFGGCCSSSKC
jgi:hypothetical protein